MVRLLIAGDGGHLRRERHLLAVLVLADHRLASGGRRRAAKQLVGELRILVRVLVRVRVRVRVRVPVRVRVRVRVRG